MSLAPGIEVPVDPAGRSPLHCSALTNDADEVRRLTAEGESVDSADRQGFTPLHLTSQEHALGAAAAMHDLGATVDQVNSFGNTPLFVAVFNSSGRPWMIDLLPSRGADPLHSNQSGQTPAGLARLIGNYDVAQYFDDVP
ncbi:ankyrin repeat protein [Pseudarthrobacter defluvii]|uniref:ankyrin repeat domain-containing protein n=1 Tax=Pseudarthrobacter defluvii TaxID=410837 RepID=UPI002781EDE8|nr:ankyrin repeat domain-containing protein [Pseudarthrobacter defluvii]MDQ0770632.1 ankyrin repeat protein [Pseudarthrobacter defluvii]